MKILLVLFHSSNAELMLKPIFLEIGNDMSS